MERTRLDFPPDAGDVFFAAIPARPAVFVLRGEGEPYVSKTSNLRRRLLRLLGPVDERSKRLNLRARVRQIEYALTGSDFESGFVLYRTLRELFPKNYRDRLKLRFAPLVKFNLDNEYPRAYVTRKLARAKGKSVYYGPFLSATAAEKFLNDALDLFKMRRCVDDLHPDPAFPGCIYSEMKMCLAPCFKGCTDAEYAHEVGRVEAFLDSGGSSLVRELETERERASAELKFEAAAALHARLEKVRAASAQRPDIARRLDQLNGLMLQPSAEPDAVAFFRVSAGMLSGPLAFPVAPQPGVHISMEARILDALTALPPAATGSAVETMEHLALLKRWYFRTLKTGELFLAEPNGELPLRKIVRGVTRVFKGEKASEWSVPAGQLPVEAKPE